jgi:hypothetical protein
MHVVAGKTVEDRSGELVNMHSCGSYTVYHTHVASVVPKIITLFCKAAGSSGQGCVD